MFNIAICDIAIPKRLRQRKILKIRNPVIDIFDFKDFLSLYNSWIDLIDKYLHFPIFPLVTLTSFDYLFNFGMFLIIVFKALFLRR